MVPKNGSTDINTPVDTPPRMQVSAFRRWDCRELLNCVGPVGL
jgi:hypothetical protein